MSRIPLPRRGMVLVLVVGCLLFISIIFSSMINRVRQENALTNRSSLNERLYQAASAIGRLAVRKLQRDFETRDPKIAGEILKFVFTDNQTGKMKDVDFTDQVLNLDVVKEIVAQFGDRWGKLVIKVNYIVDTGAEGPFNAEIRGLGKSPKERKGSIDLVVSLEHRGFRKKCKIRKEFLLTRLFAPPFHKFTLFATRGAELTSKQANRIKEIDEDGKVKGAPPLTLFNRIIRDTRPGQDGLDFTLNRPNNIIKTQASFVNNGWVYLGGNPVTRDSQVKKEPGLMLNVCTGPKGDPKSAQYGEFFHFFFDNNSKGWLGSKEWNKFLDLKIAGNDLGGGNRKVMITFVDYGHYSGLKDLNFNNQPLFTTAINTYLRDRSDDTITQGSALHLFGTPTLCTPTLVFGPVKRRYLRVFALYFCQAQRVYPIRAMGTQEWQFFWRDELEEWVLQKGVAGELMESMYNMVTTDLDYNSYWGGKPGESPPLCRLPPDFRDWEPYIAGMKNITQPTDPGQAWSSAIPRNPYVPDKADQIFSKDYLFKADPELHYDGKVSDLRPNASYLRDKMSYLIPEGTKGQFLKLSKCKFFMDKFVDSQGGKNQIFLNQVVGFENDLEIDIPLEVMKGGVIVCNGSIKITAPVINPFLAAGAKPNTPDAFGYLTFVSRRNIELAVPSSTGSVYPEFHGFLVCVNDQQDGQVQTTGPVHIKGGVACDKIETLTANGGIIEWGFGPGEVTGANDFLNPDFYGLVMGPRDMEIVVED